MEKLLNFNEPIDVNLLDNVVEAIYGPDARAVCSFYFYLCLFLCLFGYVGGCLCGVWVQSFPIMNVVRLSIVLMIVLYFIC